MRILFGVQGTGNGHISRSRTLARALKSRGVAVDYLFSGRAADGYFEMGEFGDYRTFPGITFASHQGRISGWRTLKGLSPCVSGKICVPSIVASTIWSSATSSRSVPMQLAAGANPASPSAIRRASTGRSRAGGRAASTAS